MTTISKAWWKEAIVYQIYPRSFKDSTGNGIGDLRGIISKLDYLERLGIDVVWLNPVYDSPNADNGYDISDYRNIMTEFGTMEDFDELLAGLHRRGIKLIMDLVVNHSSDEHPWFRESRSSRDNPYRDYYHWVPAEDGKPNERWSFFDPSGDAWTYDEPTNAYYLHYFSKKQPDLNWENPNLRQEIYDMMHFWFQKGIDGFRMDVITFISKDQTYPAIPSKFNQSWFDFYASGPRLHEYLQEMNREVLRHYDIMTVAEGPGTTTENVLDFVDQDRQELNMSYHFDHVNLGLLPRKLLSSTYKDVVAFKKIHQAWNDALKDKGWGTVYLGNHDQPRMVSRWANDAPQYQEVASKMLNTWLLTMRGTPYLYQGDEIGMTNVKFDNIDDYRDLETINWYEQTAKEGGDLEEFIESHKITARDNGRTPIHWDKTSQAGFSTGTPWIQVNDNYRKINVAAQENDPTSVLSYVKTLIQLRKASEALVYGSYQLLTEEDPNINAYTRVSPSQTVLIVLNFSEQPAGITLLEFDWIEETWANNYDDLRWEGAELQLSPFQAVVFRLAPQPARSESNSIDA